MKKYFLYAVVLFAALSSCKKNSYKITDREGVDGKALVKIGLFNMTTVATNLLIYNNGTRISGPIVAPYPYPGGGYNTQGNSNGDYFALTPGENKFEFFTTNPGTVNLTSLFFSTTQTVQANKRYTIYTADTAANAVAVLTEDNGIQPDSGFCNIRFINLIPNSGAAGFDFYKGNTLLKSGIKYKEFTEFFDIPASTVDSFSIRPAGSAAGPALTATAYYRFAVNTNQRIYSFLCRGYLGSTDAQRKPNVSISVNQ